MMFECKRCGTAENTALGGVVNGRVVLCSACATGTWHGQFPKVSAAAYAADHGAASLHRLPDPVADWYGASVLDWQSPAAPRPSAFARGQRAGRRVRRALAPWWPFLVLALYLALCDRAWTRCLDRGGAPHWLALPPFAVSCGLPERSR